MVMWFSGAAFVNMQETAPPHQNLKFQRAKSRYRGPGVLALIYVRDGSFGQSGIGGGWKDMRIYLKSELVEFTEKLARKELRILA